MTVGRKFCFGAVATICTVFGSAHANGISGQGTWETTLLGRDIGGNVVSASSDNAVFLYDTTLSITWLRDASPTGLADWYAATSWANNLNMGDHDDWRLPNSDKCIGYNCTGSEMGHLWYVTLGNSAGAFTNFGPFQNMKAYLYWSGLDYQAPNISDSAFYFYTTGGLQEFDKKLLPFYAMTVRNGDVSAVPEVASAATMLAGLVALAAIARNRQRS